MYSVSGMNNNNHGYCHSNIVNSIHNYVNCRIVANGELTLVHTNTHGEWERDRQITHVCKQNKHLTASVRY